MPVRSYYVLRLIIESADKVVAEAYGPQREDLGSLRRDLGYQGARRDRIRELQAAARQRAALKGELTPDEVRELGQALYDALFDARSEALFLSILAQARNAPGCLLRLEILVDDQQLPEIAALPWEFLRCPQQGGFWLGTQEDIILSRRRRREKPPMPLQLEPFGPLRIVLAVSNPAEDNTAGLVQVEYTVIHDVLNNLQGASRPIEFTFVPDATRDSLYNVLNQSRAPHIFHWIGHARLSQKNGQDVGELALLGPARQPKWTDAADLSDLMNSRQPPRIVVLQACESGALSARQGFVGVASQVLEKNIPLVAAMQYEVSNATATNFMRAFYTAVAQDEPVDRAVQIGRRTIANKNAAYERPDFATPVLFMCVDDGNLYRPAPAGLALGAGGGPQSLYAALSTLNYDLPEKSFRRYVEKLVGRRYGLVIIASPDVEQEGRWLMNRLANLAPPARSTQDGIIRINAARLGASTDPQAFWMEIARRREGVEPAKVAAHLAGNEWGKRNIFGVVANLKQALIPGFVRQVWQPLATAVQARAGEAPNAWFVFFILTEACERDTITALNLAENERPLLINLNDQITRQDVRDWLTLEAENLGPFRAKSESELDQVAETVVGYDTRHYIVLDELCHKLGAGSYDEGARQWLTL